jgi:hypothetical protein
MIRHLAPALALGLAGWAVLGLVAWLVVSA